MNLYATVSACPRDDEDLSYVYCFDEKLRYCFSLSRSSDDDDKIEVMVSDQINRMVDDLSVELNDTKMIVNLENDVASKLDGHTHYSIDLKISGDQKRVLHDSLRKIFEGKNGLRINS
jgi:hypothetical protein